MVGITFNVQLNPSGGNNFNFKNFLNSIPKLPLALPQPPPPSDSAFVTPATAATTSSATLIQADASSSVAVVDPALQEMIQMSGSGPGLAKGLDSVIARITAQAQGQGQGQGNAASAQHYIDMDANTKKKKKRRKKGEDDDEDIANHEEKYGRAARADDYDYDDDFIDDGGIEETAELFAQHIEPVHTGFYINKGLIKTKKKRPDQGGTGNRIVLDQAQAHHIHDPNQLRMHHDPKPVSTLLTNHVLPSNIPCDSQGSGDFVNSAGEATAIALTNPSPKSSKKNTLNLPPAVLLSIQQLAYDVLHIFGSGKPNIESPMLLPSLRSLFTSARVAGLATIMDEKQGTNAERKFALHDSVWKAVSKSVRCMRVKLEMKGHAIYWGDIRDDAEAECEDLIKQLAAAVDNYRTIVDIVINNDESNGAASFESENSTDYDKSDEDQEDDRRDNADCNLPRLRRKGSSTPTSKQTSKSEPFEWKTDLDQLVYESYRAHMKLLKTRNHLTGRKRTVTKEIPLWIATLKQRCFYGFLVPDKDILEAYKRIEAIKKTKDEEQKRVRKLERDAKIREKKKKKEEKEEKLKAEEEDKVDESNESGASQPINVVGESKDVLPIQMQTEAVTNHQIGSSSQQDNPVEVPNLNEKENISIDIGKPPKASVKKPKKEKKTEGAQRASTPGALPPDAVVKTVAKKPRPRKEKKEASGEKVLSNLQIPKAKKKSSIENGQKENVLKDNAQSPSIVDGCGARPSAIKSSPDVMCLGNVSQEVKSQPDATSAGLTAVKSITKTPKVKKEKKSISSSNDVSGDALKTVKSITKVPKTKKERKASPAVDASKPGSTVLTETSTKVKSTLTGKPKAPRKKTSPTAKSSATANAIKITLIQQQQKQIGEYMLPGMPTNIRQSNGKIDEGLSTEFPASDSAVAQRIGKENKYVYDPVQAGPAVENTKSPVKRKAMSEAQDVRIFVKASRSTATKKKKSDIAQFDADTQQHADTGFSRDITNKKEKQTKADLFDDDVQIILSKNGF